MPQQKMRPSSTFAHERLVYEPDPLLKSRTARLTAPQHSNPSIGLCRRSAVRINNSFAHGRVRALGECRST